ncbi:WAT1-related protein At4g01440-like [Tasmannia lanceolata]|uniref:WAT1-related protein At4g01440-like n=1 Tax=Tasmannia lanceolata TaxID=3420 RepID=UPI00406381F5
MAESKCSEWKPAFAMVAVDVAFGIVNIFLERVLREGMRHLVLVTYRQTIATLFLAPIAYVLERKSRPKLTVGIFWQLFFSAMLGATLTQYFFLLGIGYTSATFSCAFINVVPVVTFIMALPLRLETVNLKNKAGKAKVLGATVCVGGAVLLTLYRGKTLTNTSSHFPAMATHAILPINHVQDHKAEKWAIGSLALIGGCLCWSSWFLIQAKVGKKYPCLYSSTSIITFLSAFQSAILSFVLERDTSSWALKGKFQVITVVYAGTVGSGLCFLVMSWCVRKRGPVFTAAFSPLIQINVAIIDFFVFRRSLQLGSVLGSILVIIGLYILLWGKSMEVQNYVTKQVRAIDEGDSELTQV